MVIHVTNNMIHESLTIHWHGQFQRNTPFMDGVPMITQCPIHSGQTFTYRFKADPAGTFWYHSHTPGSRSDGVLGALIIHEDSRPHGEKYGAKHAPSIGEVSNNDQHVIILQDWQHEEFDNLFLQHFGNGWFWPNNPIFPEPSDRHNFSLGPDGVAAVAVPYVSALINGRGRFENRLWHQDRPVENNVPYARFYVDPTAPDNRYRFRIVGGQMAFPLRVSVDAHLVTVIATDGFDIEPIHNVESVLVTPGERYDVVITANNPLRRKAYYIRASPDLSDAGYATDQPFQEVKALLIYGRESESYVEPPTGVLDVPRPCKTHPTYKCRIVNCPYAFLPPTYNAQCIHVDQLIRKVEDVPVPGLTALPASNNFWFNTAFLRAGPSISGIAFEPPSSPPLSQRDLLPNSVTPCPASCRSATSLQGCRCTNILTLDYNKPYQLIFTNVGAGGANEGSPHPIHVHGHSFHVLKVAFGELQSNGLYRRANSDLCCPCPDDEQVCCTEVDDGYKGSPHPIHVHGHSFHVLKVAFGELQSNGLYRRANSDLCCPCPDDERVCCTEVDDGNRHLTTSTNGTVPCHSPRFVNDEWNRDPNKISELNRENPVRKDTIIVPPGGYTVIRITSDNPGWWFVHCHVELHSVAGMAFVINEAPERQPLLIKPPGFPQCGDFTWTSQDFHRAVNAFVTPEVSLRARRFGRPNYHYVY
ncbi:laccase-5 [Lingula anatina]|uniref:Laccase-5 n=1 Tax=Lingula anatina TaxID=7574 RepID=A0A2R2MIX3_LINAN|nr:laccase-5 [Lingula anatina]|eukprot:XP_023930002.1 laccase-5 [Lingula anatina]